MPNKLQQPYHYKFAKAKYKIPVLLYGHAIAPIKTTLIIF
jgi:hypothetical protein